MHFFPDLFQPGPQEHASISPAVVPRDHPAHLHHTLFPDIGAQAGFQPAVLHQEYMQALRIFPVHILINALLLHHKHFRPETQDLVQFPHGQILKVPGNNLHAFTRLLSHSLYPFAPDAHLPAGISRTTYSVFS